jgi:hypothetical protein
LKSDLAVHPVRHQLEHRVEAHIFVAVMGYCLMVTLRKKLRSCADGLTAQDVLDKLGFIMIDVRILTADGRMLQIRRYSNKPPYRSQHLMRQTVTAFLTLPALRFCPSQADPTVSLINTGFFPCIILAKMVSYCVGGVCAQTGYKVIGRQNVVGQRTYIRLRSLTAVR